MMLLLDSVVFPLNFLCDSYGNLMIFLYIEFCWASYGTSVIFLWYYGIISIWDYDGIAHGILYISMGFMWDSHTISMSCQ